MQYFVTGATGFIGKRLLRAHDAAQLLWLSARHQLMSVAPLSRRQQLAGHLRRLLIQQLAREIPALVA